VIPTTVLDTTKRIGKRGLGVYGTLSCSDIKLLGNVSWVYNWAQNPDILEECYDELGIQYIPMIHDASSDMTIVYGNSPYLLTFNEPNFVEQANMSPQQAASLWPQVQAVATKFGMKISSPSASYGGDYPGYSDPIAWLTEFFSLCSDCQVDFIATHQYDCDAESLYGAIGNFKTFNKPIWVTEFSCYGASVGADVNFSMQILPLFDGDADIQRYSWFGSRSLPADNTNIDVFDHTQNALTPVGVYYTGNNGGAPVETSSDTENTSSPSDNTSSSNAKALAVPLFLIALGLLAYLF